MKEFDERLEVAATNTADLRAASVIGCIVNHVPNPNKLTLGALRDEFAAKSHCSEDAEFHVIGAIPQNPELTACRTIDIARHLDGESAARRRDPDPPGQENFHARAHGAQHAPHLSGGIDPGDARLTAATS